MDISMKIKWNLVQIMGRCPSWEEDREKVNRAVVKCFAKMGLSILLAGAAIIFIALSYQYTWLSIAAILLSYVMTVWLVSNWATVAAVSYVFKALEELVDEREEDEDE